jgi:hypothetical protein
MTPHEIHSQPRSFDPSAVLQAMVDEWQLPDEREAPADEEPRPPWPDDADGPWLTFAELIDHEALDYRAWGTPVGDFLARQMEILAQSVRWTGATTPEEHESRIEVWDGDLRERWRAIGYEEGRCAGCRCGETVID